MRAVAGYGRVGCASPRPGRRGCGRRDCLGRFHARPGTFDQIEVGAQCYLVGGKHGSVIRSGRPSLPDQPTCCTAKCYRKAHQQDGHIPAWANPGRARRPRTRRLATAPPAQHVSRPSNRRPGHQRTRPSRAPTAPGKPPELPADTRVARSTRRRTSCRDTPPALARAVRGKPSGYTDRPTSTKPVRYASVDPATQRPTARQGDTRRDRAETARIAENSQLAGRLRRWWQVLGSNQRRLSRRFYSPYALPESPPADQRGRASRRESGLPPSAMRP